MIFAPDLPKNGDVADPLAAAKPLQDARNLLGQTDQYRWKSGAFTDPNVMTAGDGVMLVGPVSVQCSTQTTNITYALIPDDAGADSLMWKIPHNAGLVLVGGNTPMELTFTVEVPSHVWIMASYQYLRRADNGHKNGSLAATWAEWVTLFTVSGRDVRAQVKIELDGVALPGSGPFALSVDGKNRGTGTAEKGCAPVYDGWWEVGPGTHTIRMVAGQGPVWADTSDEGAASATGEAAVYNLTAMDHGVVLGSRHLVALVFPRGGRLA